ncbi:Efg1 domain-containing protein [Aspergillus mulundensis]|uniref:rRNA-processing protein EFG1 n=1 Tax=Aspergillus mulundensis TaxID=1810919 RepID=A0A3D8Q797_9EURO|nr:rRNA-processing protein efg1 [Aspergillus mulundensis]RDW57540.1 rRNA-processing protein efg1 [Aspergillus mulundensis]
MPKDFNPPRPQRKTPYPDRSRKPKSKPQQDRGEEKQHPSVNELKRRIRDAKRLLAKPELPADKRIIQERALGGYEKELADEERRRERSRMIKKYHFVRFLDRKTATKEVNRLTRKRDELGKDIDIDEGTKNKKLEKLDARLHTAKVNLNYTIYYPLTEKYISIYAERKKGDSGQNEDVDKEEETAQPEETVSAATAAEKKAMLQTIEKCMEDGTLDLLREGKLSSIAENEARAGTKTETKSKSKSQSKKDTGDKKASNKEKAEVKTSKPDGRKGKSAKHAPSAPVEESGDESDGGFFEM